MVRQAHALGAIDAGGERPGRYDPKMWLDYFRRIHADAATLSAGGCVCYYPTKIPLHYKSQWMKGTDPFGELYAGCRKLGMVVVARPTPHAVHQDVYDAHSGWIAVDARGNRHRHGATPELWLTCALGPRMVSKYPNVLENAGLP